VIESFADKGTEDVFDGRTTKAALKACPSDLLRIARRKLDMLNQAAALGDLRVPPSNRLEKLRGDSEGQASPSEARRGGDQDADTGRAATDVAG
jgi:toxin HigB-1